MSEEKLSSEQVPPKFSEWLLSMGCPPEDVPPLDKISEMCRGQYYMVWRSLMEHVGPKDIILTKRLQVFNDDITKCKKKNVFNELDVNMPRELSLWRQQMEVKEQVADAEARVFEERDRFNIIQNKVSSKLAQRNLLKKRLQDAQRRSWLLQQVGAELNDRKVNLLETKSIAASLCCVDDSLDVESKLEKCLTSVSRAHAPHRAGAVVGGGGVGGVSLLSVANPVACSSIASTNGDNDTEEHVTSLVRCRGDIVFKQLLERRAGLCARTHDHDSIKDKDRKSPQSVLAHTAALHCSLSLEALKNRAHIKQARRRLADSLNELNDNLSGESCELLVLRCERARSAARANTLRGLCVELRGRGGTFTVEGGGGEGAAGDVHTVDKAIITKRDELKRLIISAAAIERKTQNVKENLTAVFRSFHDGERIQANSQLSIVSPQESITSIRQFYEERRERRNKKLELSMDLDVSESCSYEISDNTSPKFVDELRMYLKKFSLDKNRKLVLESGEKIWIFETVQSSLNRIFSKWQEDDVTTSMLCPSINLAQNLGRLAQEMTTKNELEGLVRFLEDGKRHDPFLDITPITTKEEKTKDAIKKRLNDNLLNLQKTNKTLHIGVENLNIWNENSLKQYISDNRVVEGRSYKEYEKMFIECLRL